MERAIVHSDINHCYAQIEEMLNPELKQRPMAVGGSQEERHGIILAKNLHAKKYKIQTGETLDEARIKCPQLLILPPDYRRYQRITDQVKAIYREYTDRVEEYGLDEAWLDLTQSQRLFGPASQIARTIQQRVYVELGLTISIGLSFNKIFAKMASDFVKPSGFVTITRANFQEKIYPLSVRELFYVGAATQKKLEAWGITTIGDLASRDRQFMRRYFGKVGEMLHWFALGEDISEVALASEAIPVKSVGNSVTAVHDLHTHGEARLVLPGAGGVRRFPAARSGLERQGYRFESAGYSFIPLEPAAQARPSDPAGGRNSGRRGNSFVPGLAERAAAAQHRDQRI